MGNTANSSALVELDKNYKAQKNKHQIFGECVIYQSKTNLSSKYILKEYNFTDDPSYLREKKKMEFRQAIKSEYLLKIEGIFGSTDTQLCGQFHKLQVLVEHPGTKLDSVQLALQDYWAVLFGYVRALESLQQNQIIHGQITSRSLFLPPKICDPIFMDQNTNYQQLIQQSRSNYIFLSPQLVQALQQEEWQPQHNAYKSDVFTLGVCLLQAFTKIPCNEIYSYSVGHFNLEILEQRIQKLFSLIPKSLFDVLVSMLQLQEVRRPDFLELSKLVDNKYKEFQQQSQQQQQQTVSIPCTKDDSYHRNQQSTHQSHHSIRSFKTQPAEEVVPAVLLVPDKPDQLVYHSYCELSANICKPDENLDPLELLQEIEQDSVFEQPLREAKDYNNKISYLAEEQQPIFKKDGFSLPYDLPKSQNHSQVFGTIMVDSVHEVYQDGSRYQGQKINGMRHGQGIFYYQDGGFYEGQWEFNHMHGNGTLYYSSGKPAYQGDWSQDKFHGNGILYNELPSTMNCDFNYQDFDNVEDFWVRYEGSFNDDNKEGHGVLYLSNGEKYIGQFLRDYINGRGQFYKRNGCIIDGHWSNNKFIS